MVVAEEVSDDVDDSDVVELRRRQCKFSASSGQAHLSVLFDDSVLDSVPFVVRDELPLVVEVELSDEVEVAELEAEPLLLEPLPPDRVNCPE